MVCPGENPLGQTDSPLLVSGIGRLRTVGLFEKVVPACTLCVVHVLKRDPVYTRGGVWSCAVSMCTPVLFAKPLHPAFQGALVINSCTVTIEKKSEAVPRTYRLRREVMAGSDETRATVVTCVVALCVISLVSSPCARAVFVDEG